MNKIQHLTNNQNSLYSLKRLLIFIGKPFYFLLSSLIVFTVFLLYITGHSIRLFLITFYQLILLFFKRLIHLFKFSIPSKFDKTNRYTKDLFEFIQITQPPVKKRVKKKHIEFVNLIKIVFLKLNLLKIETSGRSKLLSLIKPSRSFKWQFIILPLIAAFIFSLLFYLKITKDLPSPDELMTRKIEATTKIYDRNGILLYNAYDDINRSPISLENIPKHVIFATLAAEDAEFYNHPGFSLRGIARAATKIISEGKVTGGSTITQQLVKNVLLSPEQTLTRKIKELILSIEVERKYSKDQILEMYLNEVSYGGTAYGIQAASRTYFNRDVENLTLTQAALLAGLPKSPSKYSPHGGNPELTLSRLKEVLHLMKINGYITSDQEKEALESEIKFADNRVDIKAPHFVMFVLQELEKIYGKEVVKSGGLQVKTSLDFPIQQLAEKIISEELEKLKQLNVGNGAVIVLNPQNGEILSMVGSKDYFDLSNQGNVNVTTSPRQPGSSIKVVNYAYALSNGYTPSSVLDDSPISYKIQGQPDYSPKNYDGTYRGKISLRSAIAESRNIPAVKVLASYGVEKMIEMGQKMGISTWEDRDRFGLSLTLGGGEVKLIELAGAYSVIANYGIKQSLTPFLDITNYKGESLYTNSCIQKDQKTEKDTQEAELINQIFAAEKTEPSNTPQTCQKEQVLDPRVAYMLTDILKDNAARSPQFGPSSYLVISNHPEVAVKTGTSNNLRDNLTIGYNQDFVVAVWVGNNDNSPMARIASGVTGASPIFNKIMSALLANKNSAPWEIPPGLVKLPICALTGTLSCDNCPIKVEWFLQENQPKAFCNPDQIKDILAKKESTEKPANN